MKYIISLFLSVFLSGCLLDSEETNSFNNIVVGGGTKQPHNTVENTLPVLVVLVNFSDTNYIHPDVGRDSQSISLYWANKIFGSNNGQLNHYYTSIFSKKFNITPVNHTGEGTSGVIIVNLPDIKYPTGLRDPDELSPGYKTNAILSEIMKRVDPFIDMATLDTNKDGFISRTEAGLVFLFGGFDESYKNPQTQNLLNPIDDGGSFVQAKSVWPHVFTNFNNPMAPANAPIIVNPSLDGVQLFDALHKGAYAIFAQRQDNHASTIGVIAHEFGHLLFELPDLYDTVDPTDAGIGYFDLMGSGSWGLSKESHESSQYPGSTPVPMSGYTRHMAIGHLDPSLLTNGTEGRTTNLWAYNIDKPTPNMTPPAIKIPTIDDKVFFIAEYLDSSTYWGGMWITDPTNIGFSGLSIKRVDLNQSNNNSETNRFIESVAVNPSVLAPIGRHLLTTNNNISFELFNKEQKIGTLSNLTEDQAGIHFNFLKYVNAPTP